MTLSGATSVSITFFNKAVFALYKFDASNTLTLGQMIFTLVFLFGMKRAGILEFEDFNLETAKNVCKLLSKTNHSYFLLPLHL